MAKPLPTARVVAGPQLLFSMLFTPLIKLTNGTANWILRRLGIEPAEELRSARSPQELGVAGAQLGAAAARWTRSPRPWWTGRCSSARARPRS